MISPAQLPSYSNESLAALGNRELIDLLIQDEDRVPRNVIDEFARRGDLAVADLEARFLPPEAWAHAVALGAWWLRLHAAMIFGLIPTANAECALVRWMRRMAEAGDENLQEWLSAQWPALLQNKPNAMAEQLRALCTDRVLDWYMRGNAMDALVATAERRGPAALEAELAWVARLAADEDEDWDTRVVAGNLLLDFPRSAHRALLESLALRQSGLGASFMLDDVREAYAAGRDSPEWMRFQNPWQFYEPEVIAARQHRWAEERKVDALRHERARDNGQLELAVPSVRKVPKIGRNDPCPCGSGRKYKKCCMLD
jgi:hypothetical protein